MKCNLKSELEQILLDAGASYNADHVYQVSYHAQKLAEYLAQMPEPNNKLLLDYFSNDLLEFLNFITDNLNMRPVVKPLTMPEIMEKLDKERERVMQFELPITEE